MENKSISDHYDDGTLDLLYSINKSITQSYRSTTGKTFENCIEKIFKIYGISYSKQVFIDFSTQTIQKYSKKLHGHRVDFVIPEIQIGESLECHWVVSCKTTLRERFLQDMLYSNCILISLEQLNPIDKILSIQICPTRKEFTVFLKFILMRQLFSNSISKTNWNIFKKIHQ